jgi:hypothetical protein
MSSIRRILSSRANGRRSVGPVTPEGKSRSARNAITHGLLSRFVLLQDESPEVFQEMIDAHLRRFLPADAVESGFIEEMAAAAWRLRRAWAMESRMLDNQVAAETTGDRLDRMAAVHADPTAQQSLDRLLRYESRLHLMYQRAFHNLLLVRTLQLPNEPSPKNGHSDDEILDVPALPPSDQQ